MKDSEVREVMNGRELAFKGEKWDFLHLHGIDDSTIERGIKVAQSKDGPVISQRKYVIDILEEIDLLNAKSIDTLIDLNIKLLSNQGEPLSDLGRYKRLVGKLNYLTVTQPNT
ncbi:hypothetical protein CR513_23116, partial [Mucuna pruriens]